MSLKEQKQKSFKEGKTLLFPGSLLWQSTAEGNREITSESYQKGVIQELLPKKVSVHMWR